MTGLVLELDLCPCQVRFLSVPAFVLARDVEIHLPEYGSNLKVDVSYGGAFYAFIPARDLGMHIKLSVSMIKETRVCKLSYQLLRCLRLGYAN